ncbi:unnamed protein product [Vicia faba]|uniref:Uncharacterized protein n=1 Tax=Vicia faba TaxID=3906 RepID=A0AAV0Z178_VICFA|nr:unnamed protein product [Vicia faba]
MTTATNNPSHGSPLNEESTTARANQPRPSPSNFGSRRTTGNNPHRWFWFDGRSTGKAFEVVLRPEARQEGREGSPGDEDGPATQSECSSAGEGGFVAQLGGRVGRDPRG